MDERYVTGVRACVTLCDKGKGGSKLAKKALLNSWTAPYVLLFLNAGFGSSSIYQ